MSEITVYEHHDDGFGRPGANDRLLRGTLIRWTDTNKWVDRDGMPPPETMIVIAVDEALQKWQGKKPVEVIRDKPLPDVNTLNEATDKNTWEIGLDNKPKPPWVHSYLVYLLDPATATTYTYVNSTRGAKLACDILRERVTTMRSLRGARVVPVVKLTDRPMKTFVGMKKRPEFEIVGWKQLGGDSGSSLPAPQSPQLPGPAIAPTQKSEEPKTEPTSDPKPKPESKPSVADATLSALEEVSRPRMSEVMADRIPW